jgi:hypothetical protein
MPRLPQVSGNHLVAVLERIGYTDRLYCSAATWQPCEIEEKHRYRGTRDNGATP